MSDPHSASDSDDRASCDPDAGPRCGSGRKERVLHTRISEQLAEEIRRAAQELRVPASNLVRNVLEEAFSALETVSDHVGSWLEEAAQDLERIRTRSRGVARDATPGDDAGDADAGADAPVQDRSSAPPAREAASPGAEAPRPRADDVLAWQAVTLNAPLVCADCGRRLVRGDRAHLGSTASGPSGTALCLACFESRFGASD